VKTRGENDGCVAYTSHPQRDATLHLYQVPTVPRQLPSARFCFHRALLRPTSLKRSGAVMAHALAQSSTTLRETTRLFPCAGANSPTCVHSAKLEGSCMLCPSRRFFSTKHKHNLRSFRPTRRLLHAVPQPKNFKHPT
jgi:hypothetical protein